MSGRNGVVVVGASAGGLSTVEALRRQGYTGSVTVVGDEKHPPYDRPPLSKQVLSGAWEPDRARLRPDAALVETGAEFVYGDPVWGASNLPNIPNCSWGDCPEDSRHPRGCWSHIDLGALRYVLTPAAGFPPTI